jgi:hypothetical protein
MPKIESPKALINFKILYQKHIRTLKQSQNVNCIFILRFDKCKVMLAGLHFYIKSIKLCHMCFKINTRRGSKKQIKYKNQKSLQLNNRPQHTT